MKKLACFLTTLIIVLNSAICISAMDYGEEWIGHTPTTTTVYRDVSEDYWAYHAIVRCSEKKWFNGYPDGTFRPEDSITRAEALTVFVQFLGLELKPVAESSFYDVNPNAWYAPYIEAGKDLFPTHTTIQGKQPFQPDMPVTREDTIYALVKALGCDQAEEFVNESVLNMFRDQNSISTDLRKYFVIALKHELVSGYPDGTICAQEALARSEFATLLMRGTEHGFHNYKAKIERVQVFPDSPIELVIGESLNLTARSTYTDGSNRDYSGLQPYDATQNGVIAVNGTTITALKEGSGTIRYNDEFLSRAETAVIVKKPDTSPVIKITDYPDKTEQDTVTISGRVSDADLTTLNLTCNGKDVEIKENGAFSATVSIEDGVNTFTFVAVNRYEAESQKTVTIEGMKKKIILFDANGGIASETSLTVSPNSPIGTLPTASRDYYRFDGWYTAKDSGTKIFETNFVSEDITLFAHWISNDLSDWVTEEQVPKGAQIEEEKYTYTITSHTSSYSDHLNGWLERSSHDEYGKYGNWSNWSANAVTASDTREVETRWVDRQTKTVYQYFHYCNGSYHANWDCYPYYHTIQSDSPLPYLGTTIIGEAVPYYSGSRCSCGVNGWYPGTDWMKNNQTTTVETVAAHTEYRYRDRSKNTLYTYVKFDPAESSEYPTGENINNIQKWVRYRIK